MLFIRNVKTEKRDEKHFRMLFLGSFLITQVLEIKIKNKKTIDGACQVKESFDYLFSTFFSIDSQH